MRRAITVSALLLLAVPLAACSSAPELDFPLVEVEAAGSVTAPGTALGLNEVGFVEHTLNFVDQGDITFVNAITLNAIEPRTVADWETLVENPEDFTDYTPTVLIVQQKVFGEVPETYDSTVVDVYPIYDDGTIAPYVIVDFALGYIDDNATCGYTLFSHTTPESDFQYCLIGAAEDEREIVGLAFNEQRSEGFMVDQDSPYFLEPITWRG